MPDTRTKADKLRDVLHGKGVTDGERKNARAALERMGESTEKPEATESFADVLARARERGWARGREQAARAQRTNEGINLNDFFDRFYRSGFGAEYRSSNWRAWSPNTSWGSPFAEAARQRAEQEELRKEVRERVRGMSTAELREYLEMLFTRRSMSRDSYDQLKCELVKDHAWADVGQTVQHHPLRRCVRCGLHQVLSHDPKDMDTHDWKEDLGSRVIADGIWTQTCRECNLRRVDPDQPPPSWRWSTTGGT